jgi:hypothetical protein
VVALLGGHLNATAPDPRAVNADVPEPLGRAILRALARKPDERWAGAREFLHALEQV